MSEAGACNVGLAVARMASERPRDPAVFAPQGRDRRGRLRYAHLTYGELQEQIASIAAGLEHHGLTRGMRAVLMVRPCLDFFPLFFGLLRAGIVPVIVDPGIGRHNLATCLAEARPDAFIGEPIAHAARKLLGWARNTSRIHVSVGGAFPFGGVSLETIERHGARARAYEFPTTRPDEIAAILFTSGSTGLSKGVVYEHGNFVAQVEMLRASYGIEAGEIDLPTFAPFALFDAALGMTTVLPEMDFARPGTANPQLIIDAIEHFGATNLFGSPALVARVGSYGSARGIRLPSLRRVISAGAPADLDDIARFVRMLRPDAEVHTPYGATEALPITSIGSRELLETRSASAAGAGVCVGKPLAGVDVWVIGIEDGALESWNDTRELPTGEIGEIVVASAAVTSRYEGRPEATASAKLKHPDGRILHRMGDLGRFDEAGRLWFCGRKAQRVESSNGRLFTIPCERVFSAHPAVRRAALVAIERAGVNIPAICIELDAAHSGVDRSAITAELLELGAAHEHTRRLRHILYHKSFPVDVRHNSKIFREQLAVWADKQLP